MAFKIRADANISIKSTLVLAAGIVLAFVGRLDAQYLQFYDVRASPFNATCDGASDDTAAIQAAVTAASTGPVAKVLVTGICKITGTISVVPQANLINPIEISGQGYSRSKLLWGGNLNGFILQVGIANGPVPVIIRDLGFDSIDNSRRAAAAIKILGVAQGSFVRNWFGNVQDGIFGSWLQTSRIDNNYFAGITRDAISLNTSSNTNNGNWIEHNEFYQCGRWCINWTDAGAAGNTIMNNDFEGTIAGTLGSIYLANVVRGTIAFNRFEDTLVRYLPFRSILLNLCHGTEITGNTFGEGGRNSDYLIQIQGATSGITMISNKFANPGLAGNIEIESFSSSDIFSLMDQANIATHYGGVAGGVGQTIAGSSGGQLGFFLRSVFGGLTVTQDGRVSAAGLQIRQSSNGSSCSTGVDVGNLWADNFIDSHLRVCVYVNGVPTWKTLALQ